MSGVAWYNRPLYEHKKIRLEGVWKLQHMSVKGLLNFPEWEIGLAFILLQQVCFRCAH